MNTIQTFTAPSGAQLRTVDKDGQIFFVGKDVATALGYVNTKSALARHCKGVRTTYPLQTAGGIQEVRIISEPDFYRLVCGSEIEQAKEFEKWVFEEVLPAIRKSGGYMVDIANETPEETMARALMLANDTMNRQKARLAQLEQQNAEQAAALEVAAPKALFADAVAQSDTCILIGELAKLLRQNGIEIGQNRLWKWMRDNRYICKANTQPTQRAMEQGLFRVIERSVVDGNGCTRLCLTTKVTGKGQQYFINLFLNSAV